MVVEPAPAALVALGDHGQRRAGHEPGDAGHRVQREHEAVAVEDVGVVVDVARVGAREVHRVRDGRHGHDPGGDQEHERDAEAGRDPRAEVAAGRPRQRCRVVTVSSQPRTSASCSVLLLMPTASAARARTSSGRAQPHRRDAPRRLERDVARQLGRALAPLAERDRQLHDAQPGAQHAVGELDLERVAARPRGRVSRSPRALRRGSTSGRRSGREPARAARGARSRSPPARRRGARRPSPRSRRRRRSASRARGRRRRGPRRAAPARAPGRGRSRSRSRTTAPAPAASAWAKPATYAGPRPRLAGRCSTATCGSAAASRSAIAPVPSGDASSTTRMRVPARRRGAQGARPSARRCSASQ